ncbi:uncharacterized protein LOC135224455 [Macrobrachium nipponense]|uniref:uncharacterized protein LOC135224455 n=1 Tax=Macrobrachium nipponense TaxID=159736 RepID=UPI0030C8D2C2
MVCRHCPKTPRRTAPLAFLLLPLVASLLMARALSTRVTTATNNSSSSNSTYNSSSSNLLIFQSYHHHQTNLDLGHTEESSSSSSSSFKTKNKSELQKFQSLFQSYPTGAHRSSSSGGGDSSSSSSITTRNSSAIKSLLQHQHFQSFPATVLTATTTTTTTTTITAAATTTSTPTVTHTPLAQQVKPSLIHTNKTSDKPPAATTTTTTTYRRFLDITAYAVKSGRLTKRKGKREEEEQEEEEKKKKEKEVEEEKEREKKKMNLELQQCQKVPLVFDETTVPSETPVEKCQTCDSMSNCPGSSSHPSCPRLEDFLCTNFTEDLLRRSLTYCPHLTLESVMCEVQVQHLRATESCRRTAHHLMERDKMVGRLVYQHSDMIMKYNCEYNYSVTQNCDACKEAYQYWVCSQFFPVYLKGHIVKPCRQFCHEVERKCPYLLPKDKPVAGEPSFLCQDPNIGDLHGQESSYGEDSCCYRMCPNEKAPGHHPRICYTFPIPATNSTIATEASINSSSPSLSSPSSGSNGSSSSSSNSGGVTSLETMDNGGDSQCLSAHGADSCLCQSNHSPVAPLSSSSCTVISRKHCWTRTALYILLLCLVRTRALMPRGFT